MIFYAKDGVHDGRFGLIACRFYGLAEGPGLREQFGSLQWPPPIRGICQRYRHADYRYLALASRTTGCPFCTDNKGGQWYFVGSALTEPVGEKQRMRFEGV